MSSSSSSTAEDVLPFGTTSASQFGVTGAGDDLDDDVGAELSRIAQSIHIDIDAAGDDTPADTLSPTRSSTVRGGDEDFGKGLMHFIAANKAAEQSGGGDEEQQQPTTPDNNNNKTTPTSTSSSSTTKTLTADDEKSRAAASTSSAPAASTSSSSSSSPPVSSSSSPTSSTPSSPEKKAKPKGTSYRMRNFVYNKFAGSKVGRKVIKHLMGDAGDALLVAIERAASKHADRRTGADVADLVIKFSVKGKLLHDTR
jgi:hypothetical protein